MVAKRVEAGNSTPRRPPATTPKAREDQLIGLAYDLAEKQLRDGSASAQVISNFIKLGTQRERLEQKKLEHEIILRKTQVDQIEQNARIEELYSNAINAMRGYAGIPQENEDEDE